MTNYAGYMGRVLEIDLSCRQEREYPWTDRDRELYIGGKAMASKIMYDNFTGGEDPFGPKNIIVIATGPVTGTFAPSSNRFDISTLSPLTGITTSSNCGGNFGYYLKKAGYDAIVIKGKSPKPVWLEIHNDSFSFHDAEDIWGTHTGKVQSLLDEKLAAENGGKAVKNGKIVIGPAGENLVLYASIVSNERLAGRGGTGAVMGWKNLKAITASGNKEVTVYDRENLDKLNNGLNILSLIL